MQKKILSGLWYKDRDAFIQLAYDTGWLGDLGKKARKGNRIFIEDISSKISIY